VDLARGFKMKDIGLMHFFHGLEVWKGDGEVFFSHGKYSNEILEKLFMESRKPMYTPFSSD